MALELDTIRQQAQRVAASHGLSVVEIDMQGGGKHRLLRIFIEKNAEQREKLFAELQQENALPSSLHSMESLSGTTLEDCEVFSKDFGTLLDMEDLVPGQAEYTLEVSSPGLDRKLFTPEDFTRFSGSLAKVQTRQPVNANRHFTGRIQDVQAADFALHLEAGRPQKSKKKAAAQPDSSTVRIAFANVEKAQLVPEF